MSYADSDAAIRARLVEVWGNTLPVAWPGYPFDPATEAPAGYIRPKIVDADADQVDMGSGVPRHRYPGTLMIQVFTPRGEGTRPGRKHGDTLADGFRRWDASGPFGKIQFRTPRVLFIAEEDAWIHHQMTVAFWRDTIH